MSTATLLLLAASLRGGTVHSGDRPITGARIDARLSRPPQTPALRGWGRAGALVASLLLASPAGAQEESVRIGTAAPSPCVTVEVEGVTTGPGPCPVQRLGEAAREAQDKARAEAAPGAPVIEARSPDVRTGVANQTATRQRMGNTFGTSVQPQRPNRSFAPRPRGAPVSSPRP